MSDDTLRNPLQWQGIDPVVDPNQAAAFSKQAQDEYDLAVAFKQTFSTEAGKRVLAYLKMATIESATWMAGMGYRQAIAHGFAREGQNALVRNIFERMELAERAKDSDEYLRMKAQAIGMPLAPKPQPTTTPQPPTKEPENGKAKETKRPRDRKGKFQAKG